MNSVDKVSTYYKVCSRLHSLCCEALAPALRAGVTLLTKIPKLLVWKYTIY